MSRLAPIFVALLLTVAARAQPNIVLIISDDAGFADWGFMDDFTGGNSPVPTPRLDELRARGVLFTNAYTAAVCSPSRAAILTGSYQQRIGYEFNINNLTNPNGTFEGLRSEDVTIFERMQPLGYTTGAIGKWHVGGIPDIVQGGVVTTPGNRPPRQGVDEFYGILRGSRNYSTGSQVGDVTRALREMSLDANGLEVNIEREAEHAGEYVTETFGQGAVDFIGRHYDDADPFFLYVSFTAPHSPVGPSPDRNAPGVTTDYGSMMFTMDKEIGRIMDKVADPAGDGSVDLTDDTLIIFINDNGGAQGATRDNSPLRNWKGSTYEGGIRVPMIFAGAGVTADPGSVYSEPVHSIDLVATCHEVAGGAPLTGIDGVNLLPFVNGVADGEPHEALVIRNRNRYGVRMGDWKLTRNGSGAAELYDLSSNIAEDSAGNLAAANPGVVAQLQSILTEHEVTWDKPRFHGLSSNVDSINRNDRFTYAPTAPGGGTFVPDLPLVGAGLRNGDFESPAFAADQRPYGEVDGWTNIGSGGQTQVLGRTNQNRSSPQNAVLPDAASRVAGLDTGHTIAEGEVFGFSYWWRDASNWNDAADRIGFRLFTTVDDTLTGAVSTEREYLSPTSTANSTYEFAEGTHTATAAEDGRRLFIAIRGADGNGATNGFARLDDVTLARGTFNADGGGTAMGTWSAGGAWVDFDTGQSDTLLDLDAFPGAVLEFPAADGFSYVASNDMTRATGLDFILNQIVLSGDFSAEDETATIDGNALLFARSLAGDTPRIQNEAGAGASGGGCFINTPISTWEGLEFGGDGDAPLTIRGAISDYDELRPSHVTKDGESTLALTGEHPFTGSLGIEEGSLLLDDALLSGTPVIVVGLSGTLGGEGEIAGDLQLFGTLRIDLDEGDRIDVGGGIETVGATTLELTGTPTDGQVIASYGLLDGTINNVTGLSPGFTVDFAHGGNQIAIVAAEDDAYTVWAEQTSGLSGADAAFDADPNGDGVPNGVAFFLGAPNASTNASPFLPTVETTPGSALLRFERTEFAADLEFDVRYSTDLEQWDVAVDGQDGISITILGAGIDSIVVEFPSALAPDGQIYCQLAVQEP